MLMTADEAIGILSRCGARRVAILEWRVDLKPGQFAAFFEFAGLMRVWVVERGSAASFEHAVSRALANGSRRVAA